MPKRFPRPRKRYHLMLEEEDWLLLGQIYGLDSSIPLGIGEACCQIIHNHCQQLRQRILEKADGKMS